MSRPASRNAVIQSLRQRLLTTQQTPKTGSVISSGLLQLDQLLPHGGVRAGSVVECVSSAAGSSAAVLALRCIRQLLKHPGALAVIDPSQEFNCAAAAAAGISLDRLLLIRPSVSGYHTLQATRSRLLWSLEQAARCPGVRAVLCWLDRASSTILRRLQLAVEASGVTVFLVRPESCLALTSWADVRLQLDSAWNANQSAPMITVRVAHSRHVVEHHGAVRLKVDHETGVVSEVPELANPATAYSGIR